MEVLVFDNYDSFTYNLVHIVEHLLDKEINVVKNDSISLDDINRFNKIICSPGPGLPSEAGLLMPLLKKYAPTKSILGVCLGHQAIIEHFGGKLINLPEVYHGVSMNCNLTSDSKLFADVPSTFKAGRYHSWTADPEFFPDELSVTAKDDFGNIMAAEHREFNICSVQFHPESVLTPFGKKILENWLFRY